MTCTSWSFFFCFRDGVSKNPPHKLKTYKVSGTELWQATIAKSESWEVGIVSDFRLPKFFSELYFLLIVRSADPADRRCDRRTDGRAEEISFIRAIYSGRMLEATREWMRANPHMWFWLLCCLIKLIIHNHVFLISSVCLSVRPSVCHKNNVLRHVFNKERLKYNGTL